MMDDPNMKAFEKLAQLWKLANDPNMKAVEEMAKVWKMVNDPSMKLAEEHAKLMNDPLRKALDELAKTENDPFRKALEEMARMENSPIMKALREMESEPFRRALLAVEGSRPSVELFQLPELRVPELHVRAAGSREQGNEDQSAGVLMRRLADSIIQWRGQLPPGQQPAILAILNGGILINVERLAEESFHGIRIEGKMQGNPCMILAHQATVQLLCYIEKVEEEGSGGRIGFIIDGKYEEV